VLTRLDQGRASSCVSHALLQSVRLRWSWMLKQRGAEGEEPPAISRRQHYWALRALRGMQGMDVGGYPSDGIRALNEGYALESDCGYSDDLQTMLTPPEPNVYRLSEDQRAYVEQYHVSDVPDERESEMKRLLWDGYFPCLGLLCDRGFEELGRQTWEFTGPSTGAHYVVMIGWTPEGALILNSWSNWGEAQTGVVGWKTIRQPELVTDVRAISIAKMPVRRAT